jgi:hypothetical protein
MPTKPNPSNHPGLGRPYTEEDVERSMINAFKGTGIPVSSTHAEKGRKEMKKKMERRIELVAGSLSIPTWFVLYLLFKYWYNPIGELIAVSFPLSVFVIWLGWVWIFEKIFTTKSNRV